MLMLISIIIFVVGTPLYIRTPPKGDIISRFCGCVKLAIGNKYKLAKDERTKDHWLDYSIGVYNQQEVEDF
uniref:Uncharacterized protein n=1 Tax=Ciona savignyi TaxID=51511 RepID=H2ZC18_CIOSA